LIILHLYQQGLCNTIKLITCLPTTLGILWYYMGLSVGYCLMGNESTTLASCAGEFYYSVGKVAQIRSMLTSCC